MLKTLFTLLRPASAIKHSFCITKSTCHPNLFSHYVDFCPCVNGRYLSDFCGDSDDKRNNDGSSVKVDSVERSASNMSKYEPFKDENAPLILDVIEERLRVEELEEIEHHDELAGLNLEHGVTGVFDIDDLVDVLNKENAQNIFVAALPPHLQYVDYIVVVTGKSLKHMHGIAEFVRRVYKCKRNKNDIIPRLEGKSSEEWFALDLGNIALHIMSKSARPIYDIENLWAVGKEYDEKSIVNFDPLDEILRKHSITLDAFQPADKLR